MAIKTIEQLSNRQHIRETGRHPRHRLSARQQKRARTLAKSALEIMELIFCGTAPDALTIQDAIAPFEEWRTRVGGLHYRTETTPPFISNRDGQHLAVQRYSYEVQTEQPGAGVIGRFQQAIETKHQAKHYALVVQEADGVYQELARVTTFNIKTDEYIGHHGTAPERSAHPNFGSLEQDRAIVRRLAAMQTAHLATNRCDPPQARSS